MAKKRSSDSAFKLCAVANTNEHSERNLPGILGWILGASEKCRKPMGDMETIAEEKESAASNRLSGEGTKKVSEELEELY